VLDAAELAGIPSDVLRDIDPVPVVPLGFAPVAPVDMANAYATFAAGGERADWFTVEKVVDSDGKTRYEHKSDPEQVMSTGIAADITYALQQVVDSGTGLTASALTCPRPARPARRRPTTPRCPRRGSSGTRRACPPP
jgi:membrane peptidoglycan carboxypeptidase